MVSFFRITIRLFEGQPFAVAAIRLLSADAYASRRSDDNLGSYTKLYLDLCQFKRLVKMKMAGMRHCTYRSDSSGITDYMRRPMNRPRLGCDSCAARNRSATLLRVAFEVVRSCKQAKFGRGLCMGLCRRL